MRKIMPEKFRFTDPRSKLCSSVLDGRNGVFLLPHYRIDGYIIQCIVSDGLGWEHVSVTISHPKIIVKRCAMWEEMCYVKKMFFEDDEVVIQIHPSEKDYVNMHNFCLHLWKPVGVELPTPAKIMV